MITGHRGLFNFKSLKIKFNLRFMSRESHISSVPLPPCWCPPYQPVHAWVFPPRQEVPWDSTAVGHHALCFHPPTISSQDQIKHRATRTVGQTTLHTLSFLSKRESRGRETQSHNHLPWAVRHPAVTQGCHGVTRVLIPYWHQTTHKAWLCLFEKREKTWRTELRTDVSRFIWTWSFQDCLISITHCGVSSQVCDARKSRASWCPSSCTQRLCVHHWATKHTSDTGSAMAILRSPWEKEKEARSRASWTFKESKKDDWSES